MNIRTKITEMPNGVRRQRNTRHANRQRNVHRADEVQAHPVQPVEDAPVVQAEAVEGRLYTRDEMADIFHNTQEQVISRYSDTRDKLEELTDKYEKLKSGTLLSFQEVEIEDLQQENFELKAELGLAAEKIDQLLRVSEDKMLSTGNKGVNEFIQKTFIKTWKSEKPSIFTIDGHQFTVIPHNCPELNKQINKD